MKKILIVAFLFTSCYNVERNCIDFKTGVLNSHQKLMTLSLPQLSLEQMNLRLSYLIVLKIHQPLSGLIIVSFC